MIAENVSQIENKNLSPRFLDAVEEIVASSKSLKKKKYLTRLEIGKQEGLPNTIISEHIRNALRGLISDRQIQRYLPDGLKRKYNKSDIMSETLTKKVIEDNSILPIRNETSPELEQSDQQLIQKPQKIPLLYRLNNPPIVKGVSTPIQIAKE